MLRKPAKTTPKQFQTTWCFGKDWQHAGWARDLQSPNRVPRNPAIPLRLQKSIAFWQSCAIFRKKVTAAISLQEVVLPSCVETLLPEQNPTLISCTGEGHLWESKFYVPFQLQKWASNKSNSSVTSSCASCGFLRSRLESQSWNSFNPFPIVNRVSAGVPTPPDSGKAPQQHQNWHKTVVKRKFCISSLLTESAGVIKSKLSPIVNKGFIRF